MGRKLKIGITGYPVYGGSGVVATELGLELARRGHEIHFITYAMPFRLSGFVENVFYHEVEVPIYPLFDYPPYSLALAVAMLFPVLWMLETSIKENRDVYAVPAQFFGFDITLDHYKDVFVAPGGGRSDLSGSFLNSVVVAGASTVLATVLGVPAAWAYSRFTLKAKKDQLFFILSTRFMPPVVVVIRPLATSAPTRPSTRPVYRIGLPMSSDSVSCNSEPCSSIRSTWDRVWMSRPGRS